MWVHLIRVFFFRRKQSESRNLDKSTCNPFICSITDDKSMGRSLDFQPWRETFQRWAEAVTRLAKSGGEFSEQDSSLLVVRAREEVFETEQTRALF